jgi:hypothetical protein
MKHTQRLRRYAIVLATVLAAYGGISSARGDIISDWANVKSPPPAELKPVVIDSRTTVPGAQGAACCAQRCSLSLGGGRVFKFALAEILGRWRSGRRCRLLKTTAGRGGAGHPTLT